MNGQWVGTFSGSSTGKILLDVDEFSNDYGGIAFLKEDDATGSSFAVEFKTTNKSNPISFHAKVFPLDPNSPYITIIDQTKAIDTNVMQLPKTAEVTGEWSDTELTLSWNTDIGTHGTCRLPKSRASMPSSVVAIEKTWNEFKEYVASLGDQRLLFRGQSDNRRLRTSFHRTGRADLFRYINEDRMILHRRLSARTNHLFNLNIPDENGAFLNLLQHHGYPTPLLDWTSSPFVAAYFAFGRSTKMTSKISVDNHKVRIYVFDQKSWKLTFLQYSLLMMSHPHFSIAEFLSIENERMIPQQAVSVITNIDDIETYIRNAEVNAGKTFLQAIDIPFSDRQIAVRELQLMGITAGSLFPGLDGICEELRERMFFNK